MKFFVWALLTSAVGARDDRLCSTRWGLSRESRPRSIKVGADADITVFDPATVADRSTYQQPALPSVGFRHVLVNGVTARGTVSLFVHESI